jgi:murein DD-endopeptidase MepM/ murein hydrolase activator NlpD
LPLTSISLPAEAARAPALVEPDRRAIRYLDRLDTFSAQFKHMLRLSRRALARGWRLAWMYLDAAAYLALMVAVAQARWGWVRFRYHSAGLFYHVLTVMELALRQGERSVDAGVRAIVQAPNRLPLVRHRLRWQWALFRRAQRRRLARAWEDAELALHYGEYWVDTHVADALAALAPALDRLRRLPRRQVWTYTVTASAASAGALTFVVLILVGAQGRLPITQAPSAMTAAALASHTGARLLRPDLAAAPLTVAATQTPEPTLAPSATPEPVLTATPIANSYAFWDSGVPWEGGWDGIAECYGGVYAPAGSGAFIWPTDGHYLVGKNYNWRWHPGLDLAVMLGGPVYAMDSGVVVYAGWNVYGYGNMIILDHGNGWHTLYAHLSEVSVACGEGVVQGDVIGLGGSTGNSTGPHLHLEMRGPDGRVSPWGYLP